MLVYGGICALDGVSPGVSRVCADLPAKPIYGRGQPPCMSEPPKTSQVWIHADNCETSLLLVRQSPSLAKRPVYLSTSVSPKTACQAKAVQPPAPAFSA